MTFRNNSLAWTDTYCSSEYCTGKNCMTRQLQDKDVATSTLNMTTSSKNQPPLATVSYHPYLPLLTKIKGVQMFRSYSRGTPEIADKTNHAMEILFDSLILCQSPFSSFVSLSFVFLVSFHFSFFSFFQFFFFPFLLTFIYFFFFATSII